MGQDTKIEWTDHTFNPWIGCTHVSPACDHCYAENSTAARSTAARVGQPTLWGPGAKRYRTAAANWAQPLKWNRDAAAAGKRAKVFCASLADVFDNEAPAEWRADLFRLIRATPNLDWLLLTKRIGNATRMMDEAFDLGHLRTSREPFWPWPNVWIGATVVNQEEADRDIPKLLAVPARVRFLSMEPLLGPVALRKEWLDGIHKGEPFTDSLGGKHHRPFYGPHIDWVIVGGESGADARAMYLSWARDLRDGCAAAGVPFLFKQWGEWIPAQQPYHAMKDHPPIRQFGYDIEGEHRLHRIGKAAAGRLLDGIEHNGFPEVDHA